jgi:hypothetical protein
MKPLKKFMPLFKVPFFDVRFWLRMGVLWVLGLGMRPVLQAGGWWPEPEMYRFVLFNPSLSGQIYQPFYFSSAIMYDPENTGNRYLANDQNLAEWQAQVRFPGNRKAIDHVLNHVTPEEFAGWLAQRPAHPLSANPFMAHLEKKKLNEAIDYLAFAKECEVLNNHFQNFWNQNTWDQDPEPKGADQDFRKLMAQGTTLHQQTRDPFLRFRIGFQLVRLARYADDSLACHKYYQQFFANRPASSIVHHWATWHYAEMVPDVGLRNYLMSLVFEKAHDKKVRAFKLLRFNQ